MHETEAKARVESHEGLEDKLKSIGFQYVRETNELNSMYDFFGLLRKQDRALRLRKDETGCRITYKGKQGNSDYKHRREIEFRLPSVVYSVLHAIIPNRLEYEKRRITYKWQGCTVCLDEVKWLGKFVEVEGTETGIKQVLDYLGITETTKEPYPEMVAKLSH